MLHKQAKAHGFWPGHEPLEDLDISCASRKPVQVPRKSWLVGGGFVPWIFGEP